jgi:hypothetical protein
MPDPYLVPNETLVKAGLELMKQAGKPMERLQAKGRAMIYRAPGGETVRVRSCNDHVLIVVADQPDPDKARLNVEGTDFVLIAMPERPRTPGPVIGYLVPTDIVCEAVRSGQRHWLATNPNTKGDNRTWALWFNTNTLSDGSGFHEKWKAYRLGGAASAGLTSSLPMAGSPVKKLGEVIALAKQEIAEAAGVPVERVKISIDA